MKGGRGLFEIFKTNNKTMTKCNVDSFFSATFCKVPRHDSFPTEPVGEASRKMSRVETPDLANSISKNGFAARPGV